MDTDFPAAHSMDCYWFAVDQDGHVAFFDTGEAGLVPEQAFGAPWAVEEVGLERMRPLLAALYPGGPPAEDPEVVLFNWEELARLGLFVYESAGDPVPGPYDRSRRPKNPLHVDQLPPDVREQLQGMRFKGLCFGQARRVWPIDHAACDGWDPAYLASDRKTVCPLPGYEEGYAAFCAALREQLGDRGKGLRFEGPQQQPGEEE